MSIFIAKSLDGWGVLGDSQDEVYYNPRPIGAKIALPPWQSIDSDPPATLGLGPRSWANSASFISTLSRGEHAPAMATARSTSMCCVAALARGMLPIAGTTGA